MKKLEKIMLTLAVMIPWTLGAQNEKPEVTTPATDSHIEYIGRTLITDEGVSFDYSGTYIRIRFEGKSLAIRCSDTKGDWFNVWTDREMDAEEDARFKVSSRDTVIVVAEKLRKGRHEVLIQKRTEGEQGTFTLHEVITEKPLLQAKGQKKRHIEFIGDSYTCGYGTEASHKDTWCPETENCALTYAAIVSRFFDADYNLVSHSGRGVVRNYNDGDEGNNMPDRYKYTFDESREHLWMAKAASYEPDIAVIYLGTNVFSCGKKPSRADFCKRYTELLHLIKDNYGKKFPIICMSPKWDDQIYEYIRHAVQSSGLKNVAYMGVTQYVHNETSEHGADGHPNYQGHRKIASVLIPYISTMTGWKMEEKPIR